jgi:ABC-type lipopolysaccharide export system ATPase subunit
MKNKYFYTTIIRNLHKIFKKKQFFELVSTQIKTINVVGRLIEPGIWNRNVT